MMRERLALSLVLALTLGMLPSTVGAQTPPPVTPLPPATPAPSTMPTPPSMPPREPLPPAPKIYRASGRLSTRASRRLRNLDFCTTFPRRSRS